MMKRVTEVTIRAVLLLVLLGISVLPIKAIAQDDQGQFSLQVSPSPIVATVVPGVQKTLELTVRNNNTQAEDLRMSLRKFTVNSQNSEVSLTEEVPGEVVSWVTFAAQEFRIDAGSVFTQKITISPPESAGFSYSFAILVSRADEGEAPKGATQIKASVAVFTLLSVDKPGAKRSFQVAEFSTPKRVYEYLPTQFNIKLKNTGNTIVQPYGNIYLQRSAASNDPITTLPLNVTGSYILPDSSRTVEATWSDGFPAYVTTKAADNASEKQQLSWDWSKAERFRFGKYTAKLVAVYNDGQRDVPIEAVVSFWVIPWKLMLGVIVLGILVLVGVVVIVKKLTKPLHRKRKKHATTQQESED